MQSRIQNALTNGTANGNHTDLAWLEGALGLLRFLVRGQRKAAEELRGRRVFILRRRHVRVPDITLLSIIRGLLPVVYVGHVDGKSLRWVSRDQKVYSGGMGGSLYCTRVLYIALETYIEILDGASEGQGGVLSLKAKKWVPGT